MVHPVIRKYLPYVNFIVASVALSFQVAVLYPWHYKLQREFNELQNQQEAKLREYHELKMQTIKSIEHNLLELREEKKNESKNQSTETL